MFLHPMNDPQDTFDTEASFEPEPIFEPFSSELLTETRLTLAAQTLRQIQESLGHVLALLEGAEPAEAIRSQAALVAAKQSLAREIAETSAVQVIEGVFDGQNMIGSDGKMHAVPENYASKSLLVEGDMLKLVLKRDGTHVFKQIGRVERRRLSGVLSLDVASDEPVVGCGGRTYKVLPASVSYFKAVPGDRVTLVVPKSSRSVWGAMEHVVK